MRHHASELLIDDTFVVTMTTSSALGVVPEAGPAIGPEVCQSSVLPFDIALYMTRRVSSDVAPAISKLVGLK